MTAAVFAEWAARYVAELGWPVFPVKPGDKVPAIPTAHPPGDPLRGVCKGGCGQEGHGCHDATTDLEAVERWATLHPDANIGLATGHLFDALDLDGPAGEAAFDRWCAGHGWSPNLNLMVVGGTPSDGQHWLVQPTGAGNRKGMLDEVDWRGRGGYIVAAPSRRPDGEYVWCPGLLPWDNPVPPCPEELAELARGAQRSVGPARPATPLDVALGDCTRYGRSALERACDKIINAPRPGPGRKGARNETLFGEARCIFQLVAGGELVEHLAFECLLAAGLETGLSEHDVRGSLDSACSWGTRRPRRRPA